ncbi:hypothetical protein KSP40_PGU013937 [Platanthera guangdongensis]|uniref:Uncharacterized protein n=1 Tax=Platanthera guangdongensis TaxID=2320717 RepID=A0ABR2LV21_9ASPA
MLCANSEILLRLAKPVFGNVLKEKLTFSDNKRPHPRSLFQQIALKNNSPEKGKAVDEQKAGPGHLHEPLRPTQLGRRVHKIGGRRKRRRNYVEEAGGGGQLLVSADVPAQLPLLGSEEREHAGEDEAEPPSSKGSRRSLYPGLSEQPPSPAAPASLDRRDE